MINTRKGFALSAAAIVCAAMLAGCSNLVRSDYAEKMYQEKYEEGYNAGYEACIRDIESGELTVEIPTTASTESVNDAAYIINIKTGTFHNPSCSSVLDMLEKNKQESNATREELVNAGYKPCGKCKP